jgi:hypothetical protein
MTRVIFTVVKGFQILHGNYLSALQCRIRHHFAVSQMFVSSVTLCTNLGSHLPTLAQLYWAQIRTLSALASFS